MELVVKGGFKPQLRQKQVGRIITPVILDVRVLKQKTFDVER